MLEPIPRQMPALAQHARLVVIASLRPQLLSPVTQGCTALVDSTDARFAREATNASMPLFLQRFVPQEATQACKQLSVSLVPQVAVVLKGQRSPQFVRKDSLPVQVRVLALPVPRDTIARRVQALRQFVRSVLIAWLKLLLVARVRKDMLVLREPIHPPSVLKEVGALLGKGPAPSVLKVISVLKERQLRYLVCSAATALLVPGSAFSAQKDTTAQLSQAHILSVPQGHIAKLAKEGAQNALRGTTALRALQHR